MMTLPVPNGGRAISSISTKKMVSIGNYRFTGNRLGKGNFARVDEAIHTVLDIKVAIKIMDTTSIKEDYVVRNLYREAKIMAKLCHPSIAALFQTMQYGNLYYLVTELVGGGDLCGFIKKQRSGKLEERFVRIYARQLISAISHMHNIGIVHRDLKMENIMLNAIHTQIKIVDFGLSNFYRDDNPLRTHCGSPEYAAPELFVEDKHYGPEVDLWSLGVILYGMVIGQLPFNTVRCSTLSTQQRRKKLLEQINKGIATVQRRALHGLSVEFKAMIGKLLVADPAKRIKIPELIFHAWVTERGRKAVRSNPLKRLDEHDQLYLIQEVAHHIQMDWMDVQQAIKYDPQCNIAGIYNILEYNQLTQNLQGDGITKTLTTEAHSASHSYRPTTVKEAAVMLRGPRSTHHQAALKSAPIQKLTKKKTGDNVVAIHTAGMHLRSSKVIMSASGDCPKLPIIPREHPVVNSFMLPAIHAKKSPMPQIHLRRRELKSSPMPNNINKYTGNVPFSSRHPREQISKDIIIKAASAKKPSEETRRFLINNYKLAEKTISPTKHADVKIQSPARKKECYRCESSAKQTTTPNEKKRCVDKPLKRKSLLPVLVPNMLPPLGISTPNSQHQQQQLHGRGSPGPSCSQGRPQTRASMGGGSAPAKSLYRHSTFNCDYSPIDNKCSHATGDAVKRLANIARSAKLTKCNFFNEPIARSIAGYVANNIPGKLQALKWIKSNKSGRGS